jgi:hypothetical protein
VTAWLLVAAAAAPATTTSERFDRTGHITGTGKTVSVSGTFSCANGLGVELRVTLSQHATGAAAEGILGFPCIGTVEHWKLVTKAIHPKAFHSGCARAVGLAVVFSGRTPVAADQWTAPVTLVRGGVVARSAASC